MSSLGMLEPYPTIAYGHTHSCNVKGTCYVSVTRETLMIKQVKIPAPLALTLSQLLNYFVV